MGHRTHMVEGSFHRSLRGAAGVALVVWAGLFHTVGLSDGARAVLGPCEQASDLRGAECLVLRDGRTDGNQDDSGAIQGRAASPRVGALCTPWRISDSCLAVGSDGPKAKAINQLT